MPFKVLKDTGRFVWTKHSALKMKFYGLSESKVKNVINRPQRTEEGVAPKTVAVMSPYGGSRATRQPYRGEIWVMYQLENQKLKIKNQNLGKRIKIISAWRYPGVSPIRGKIPIPPEILEELNELL